MKLPVGQFFKHDLLHPVEQVGAYYQGFWPRPGLSKGARCTGLVISIKQVIQ